MKKFKEMTKEEKKELAGGAILVGAGAIFGAVAMKYGIDLKEQHFLKTHTDVIPQVFTAHKKTDPSDVGYVLALNYVNPKNNHTVQRASVVYKDPEIVKGLGEMITEWSEERIAELAGE